MINNLLRTARLTTLRIQLWWTRYAMEQQMADPKRRRKADTKPTTPPAVRRRRKAEVVAAPAAAAEEPTLEQGISMAKDVLAFYVADPIMEKRRMHFNPQDLIQLIGESLLRRGMPNTALDNTRWVWVGGKNGCPELFLILPGIEA